MSLNIKNPTTVAVADELARRQGMSKTAAIHQALSERLQFASALRNCPERDRRSDEDIVGYDENGIPN